MPTVAITVSIVEELLIKEKKTLEARIRSSEQHVAEVSVELEEAQQTLSCAEGRYAEVVRSLANLEAL